MFAGFSRKQRQILPTSRGGLSLGLDGRQTRPRYAGVSCSIFCLVCSHVVINVRSKALAQFAISSVPSRPLLTVSFLRCC